MVSTEAVSTTMLGTAMPCARIRRSNVWRGVKAGPGMTQPCASTVSKLGRDDSAWPAAQNTAKLSA